MNQNFCRLNISPSRTSTRQQKQPSPPAQNTTKDMQFSIRGMNFFKRYRQLSDLHHNPFHKTYCDFPRHFPTENDRKRHGKTPFHNQKRKQDPKNKHNKTIGAIDCYKHNSQVRSCSLITFSDISRSLSVLMFKRTSVSSVIIALVSIFPSS